MIRRRQIADYRGMDRIRAVCCVLYFQEWTGLVDSNGLMNGVREQKLYPRQDTVGMERTKDLLNEFTASCMDSMCISMELPSSGIANCV